MAATTATATTLPNGDVVFTFNALGQLGKFPAGVTALKVARIHYALKTAAQDVLRQEHALHEECALRDEDGQPKTALDDDGKDRYVPDPKRRLEFAAKYRELMAGTSEIVAPRLSFAELDQVLKKTGFDPGCLSYLLPFVDEPPDPAAFGEAND